MTAMDAFCVIVPAHYYIQRSFHDSEWFIPQCTLFDHLVVWAPASFMLAIMDFGFLCLLLWFWHTGVQCNAMLEAIPLIIDLGPAWAWSRTLIWLLLSCKCMVCIARVLTPAVPLAVMGAGERHISLSFSHSLEAWKGYAPTITRRHQGFSLVPYIWRRASHCLRTRTLAPHPQDGHGRPGDSRL